MNEVTNSNFKELMPEISGTFAEADFIAFDCEFTGIHSTADKASDIVSRFQSVSKGIETYAVVQVGFTAFKHAAGQNRFDAKSYKFYLVPRTLPGEKRRFEWQVATLEFLATQRFDFNKVIYDGISYTNKVEEISLKEQLLLNTLQNNVEQYMSIADVDVIKEYVQRVKSWYFSGSTDAFKVETSSSAIQYLLHKELRKKFPCVWTISADKAVIAMKTTPQIREILIKEEGAALEEALIDSYTGFSKLLEYLSSLKKPMVGHNILLDLMFMYKQFYGPLGDYDTFITDVFRFFPRVYDTKYIVFKLFQELQQSVHSRDASLGDVYNFLKASNTSEALSHSPLVVLDDSTDINVQFHDAGWDSFCTGYIFIKIAYMFASKEPEISSSTEHNEPLSFSLILRAVKDTENTIFDSHCKHIKQGKLQASESTYQRSLTESNGQSTNMSFQILRKCWNHQNTDAVPFTQRQSLSTVAHNTSFQSVSKRLHHNKPAHGVRPRLAQNALVWRFPLWNRVAVSTGALVWRTRWFLLSRFK